MQHARPAVAEGGRILTQPIARAAGFVTDDLDSAIRDEGMEHADGV